MKCLRITVLLLIASQLILGCKPSHDTAKLPAAQQEIFTYSFTVLPTEIIAGTPVVLRLCVKNLSNEPQDFMLPSPMVVRFSVYGSHDTLVWSSDYGKSYITMMTKFTVPAQDSFVHVEEWNAKTNDGLYLRMAKYRTEAFFVPTKEKISTSIAIID